MDDGIREIVCPACQDITAYAYPEVPVPRRADTAGSVTSGVDSWVICCCRCGHNFERDRDTGGFLLQGYGGCNDASKLYAYAGWARRIWCRLWVYNYWINGELHEVEYCLN
jgi:hypothetical protein